MHIDAVRSYLLRVVLLAVLVSYPVCHACWFEPAFDRPGLLYPLNFQRMAERQWRIQRNGWTIAFLDMLMFFFC